MTRRRLSILLLCSLAVGGLAPAATAIAKLNTAQRTALNAAIASPARTPANVARDRYRHPAATLAFFDVKPNHSVVEIWPGGGWYTEILAPYLAQGGGAYIAAAPANRLTGMTKLIDADAARYGKIRTANFPILNAGGTPVASGSADVVLTFRNVHNWMMGDKPFEAEAFKEMYAMLKPGGTLGVVEHRLGEKADVALEKKSGYVKTSTVRRLAEAAGFKFAGASEVNANPRDTKNYDKGVWTLPPTLTLKDVDREKYVAIGESDRMTLKFVKPK
ncbi:MAG: methyltransferase domain-containing protein [Hyphomicrobium sp.]|nr:methyltransferase domain-containing protein [Hyphomicrobium sp.]